jgi:hypothetical protein
MAERDHSKRYNHPRSQGGAPKGTEGAAAKAEATAGSPPSATDPKGAIHKPDEGPAAGHDATWGVVAERHSRERQEASDRQMAEMKDMHARHGKEMQALSDRHSTELSSMNDLTNTLPPEEMVVTNAGHDAQAEKDRAASKKED